MGRGIPLSQGTGQFLAGCLPCCPRLPPKSGGALCLVQGFQRPVSDRVTPPIRMGAKLDQQNEPQKDWANRTFEGGGKGIAGCVALLFCIVGLPILLLSHCSSSAPVKQDQAATNEQASAPDTPDETAIVTECDLAVKSSLTSESSYDPDFSWKYSATGNQAEVMRKFEATNGFNAKLSSAYLCRYDWGRKRIAFLQIVSPYGTRMLIAPHDGRPNKGKIKVH